jgi:hypothetical protein
MTKNMETPRPAATESNQPTGSQPRKPHGSPAMRLPHRSKAGFANIAHARRHARDDQRILALYGYA